MTGVVSTFMQQIAPLHPSTLNVRKTVEEQINEAEISAVKKKEKKKKVKTSDS